MKRKKWTSQTELTESLLKSREKRKWQIALRRYVFEENPSSFYAPYFGLDIKTFRKWIESQFDQDLDWANFSEKWQLDHVIPVNYFDFSEEEELRLCWNFTNIRVERLDSEKNQGRGVGLLASKAYFKRLFEHTGYALCGEMVNKIERIELAAMGRMGALENVMLENKEHILLFASFSPDEFTSLNKGVDINKILEEREFIKKYGLDDNQ